ncbi:non-homologous end joining protein Ku [Amycolatopsis sp. NBRC 101858]|uniref:non-homologous end joining protein Ku n=1 Tax=Amycolatopsis sp. NBRC 101858 TaxID=3032200 RepID=UPI0024A2EFB7|nr:Ku protein [Amycolatopsis sp. NBRC 101858]GLY37387.1 non-homologous end joining protein Ku [Amycolatopsis sp. NBRC 101858]
MARPVWSGALSLGLVTVPVELYPAVADHTIHFHQFERGTSDRIRNRKVNERTGDEVTQDEIVKGYDLGGGDHVLVEPGELDEIAPERSRRIDIEQFVGLDEIDPWFYDRTYWLKPAKEDFAKAYGLLLKAMDRSEKAGVAKFVLRGKEYLAAVRAGEDVMVLNTLHFVADLRKPKDVMGGLPSLPKPRPKELDMALALVDEMTAPWKPGDYRDEYSERVEKLIKAKEQGKEIAHEEEPERSAEVVDLFEALSRSVKNRKGGGKKKDLAGLSKADLDKLAREQGVKGRSKMTRAQLEKALKAS